MTSSSQEEKLCRYPSNDDPINLSISKKNKNKSRISFRPHKKKKIITRGWFSCSYLMLVDCRCEAAETTPDRVLAFFVDFARIVTIGHVVKYSLQRIAVIRVEFGAETDGVRYDARVFTRNWTSPPRRRWFFLEWPTLPEGIFRSGTNSDCPSWNSMTLMPCFSIVRQV